MLVIMLSAASGALVAAQLYRWVDDKGNVEYRDTPPPQSAKKVEERRMGGNTIQTSTPAVQRPAGGEELSRHAVGVRLRRPVQQRARASRAARRAVHGEGPERRPQGVREADGQSPACPCFIVGSARLTGYLESDWDNTLDSAGYPRTAAAAGVNPAGKPAPKPAAKPGEEPKPTAEQKPAPTDKPVAAAPDRSVPYPKPAK